MAKSIEIEKLGRTEVPAEYQKEEGCIAFQIVKVKIVFFGNVIEDRLDTKILADGRQVVHGGNGYIKDGTEI